MPVSVNDPVTEAALSLGAASADGSVVNPDILIQAESMLGALPTSSRVPFIKPIISLLLNTDKLYSSGVDPRLLLQFLKVAVYGLSFDQVLEIITLDNLLSGLTSANTQLQEICIDVLSKADPTDERILDESLLWALVSCLAVEDVLPKASLCLQTLITSHVKARQLIFSSRKIVALIKELKSKGPSSFPWAMELIEISSRFDDISLDDEFYDFEIPTDDPLLLLNVIQFYEKIACSLSEERITPLIHSRLRDIFQYYASGDSGDDVGMVKMSYGTLCVFFGALSIAHPDLYWKFDQDFNVTVQNSSDMLYLKEISPKYIFLHYPTIIHDLGSLKSSTLPAFMNFIGDEKTYRLLHLSSSGVMSLQPPQRMLFLRRITSTAWGAADLLQSWPQVMDFLINDRILEPEIYHLKKDVLENLVIAQRDILYESIWKDRVLRGYGSTNSALSGQPQVTVSTI